MTWTEILILAVVQGITEFLPISSDGHLVVAEKLLGAKYDLVDVNIVLHAGTLASILVFYWHRAWRLVLEDRRVIWLLVVGTLPAVVVGLPMKKYGEAILTDVLLAGVGFLITGAFIVIAARRPPGQRDYEALGVWETVFIGALQAFAILPGVSRSGSTIFAALVLGLKRQAAVTFSFLLAIPAISGAVVLETKDLLTKESLHTPPEMLAVGTLVSFVVGLAALAWLIRWVERGKLHYFAYWVIPVGIAVVIWQLVE